jgi:hypothetical protein
MSNKIKKLSLIYGSVSMFNLKNKKFKFSYLKKNWTK